MIARRWDRSAGPMGERVAVDRPRAHVLDLLHGQETPDRLRGGKPPIPFRVKEVMPMSSHGLMGVTVEVAG